MSQQLPQHLSHLQGIIAWRTIQGPFGRVETLYDAVNMDEPLHEIFIRKEDITTLTSVMCAISTAKSALQLVSRWYDGVNFIYCFNGKFVTYQALNDAHKRNVLTICELFV